MKSRKNEKADSRNNTNSWRNNNNKTTNQQTDEIEALTNKKTEEPIQKSQFANNNLQDNEVESIDGDTSINSSLNAIQRKTLESDDAKMMRAIQRKTLESDDAKMMRAIQRKTLESNDAKMMQAIQRKTLESDDAKMMRAIQRKTLEDKYPIQAKFTDNNTRLEQNNENILESETNIREVELTKDGEQKTKDGHITRFVSKKGELLFTIKDTESKTYIIDEKYIEREPNKKPVLAEKLAVDANNDAIRKYGEKYGMLDTRETNIVGEFRDTKGRLIYKHSDNAVSYIVNDAYAKEVDYITYKKELKKILLNPNNDLNAKYKNIEQKNHYIYDNTKEGYLSVDDPAYLNLIKHSRSNAIGNELIKTYITDAQAYYHTVRNPKCSPTTYKRVVKAYKNIFGEEPSELEKSYKAWTSQFLIKNKDGKYLNDFTKVGLPGSEALKGAPGVVAREGYGEFKTVDAILEGELEPGSIIALNLSGNGHSAIFIGYTYNDTGIIGVKYWNHYVNPYKEDNPTVGEISITFSVTNNTSKKMKDNGVPQYLITEMKGLDYSHSANSFINIIEERFSTERLKKIGKTKEEIKKDLSTYRSSIIKDNYNKEGSYIKHAAVFTKKIKKMKKKTRKNKK